MPLQPSLLMLIAVPPMSDFSEATPDEEPEQRPVRAITRIVEWLRTATRVHGRQRP